MFHKVYNFSFHFFLPPPLFFFFRACSIILIKKKMTNTCHKFKVYNVKRKHLLILYLFHTRNVATANSLVWGSYQNVHQAFSLHGTSQRAFKGVRINLSYSFYFYVVFYWIGLQTFIHSFPHWDTFMLLSVFVFFPIINNAETNNIANIYFCINASTSELERPKCKKVRSSCIFSFEKYCQIASNSVSNYLEY